MMLLTAYFVPAYMVAALVSTGTALPQQVASKERFSPCPNLFQYESTDQSNRWTGKLLVQSDDELNGVWIRMIFNNPIENIAVDGNYEGILQPNESKQVLIKNGDVLLKAGSQSVIKITVKYSGKFPELLEYRLNAKTICPEPNTERVDFFKGDEHSKDILTSILSSPMSTILNQKSYECGVKSLRSSKYPWQADIFIRHGDTVNFACEATLISPLHLITSAHCVTFKNKDIEVPASILTVHLRDPHDSKDVNRATVAKVKVHPGYNLNTLFSDIAVLQLNDALAVTDGVRPICLSGKLSYDGELVLTGYEVGKRGDHRDELKETAVSRIDENVCSKRAPELQRIIGEDTYCVTYPSADSPCVGGSGSSLISVEDKIATLRGLVTVGLSLQDRTECNKDSVVITTGIDKHLKWIVSVLNGNL